MRIDPDNSPEADAFVARLARSLSFHDLPNDEDRRCCEMYARSCHSHGFELLDAMRFIQCTYEYNPTLDEEVALVRMAMIEAKYRQR